MSKTNTQKKYRILFFITCMFIIASCPIIPTRTVVASDAISPKSDDIGWQYRRINGKLYKRLYNYTTKTWIGNWILVG